MQAINMTVTLKSSKNYSCNDVPVWAVFHMTRYSLTSRTWLIVHWRHHPQWRHRQQNLSQWRHRRPNWRCRRTSPVRTTTTSSTTYTSVTAMRLSTPISPATPTSLTVPRSSTSSGRTIGTADCSRPAGMCTMTTSPSIATPSTTRCRWPIILATRSSRRRSSRRSTGCGNTTATGTRCSSTATPEWGGRRRRWSPTYSPSTRRSPSRTR